MINVSNQSYALGYESFLVGLYQVNIEKKVVCMHVCFSLRLNIGPNDDRDLIKNHIALSQDAVVQN